MIAITQIRSFSVSIRILVLIALLATTFLAIPVLAEGEGTTVSVERLKGIGVGMKIVFPDDISADLNVFINGVKMKCEVVASNTLYCVGPLRPKEYGNLTIFGGASNIAIFTTKVVGPASNNQRGEEADDCVQPNFGIISIAGSITKHPPQPPTNQCPPVLTR
jgi:hypothetical protein